VFAVEDGAIAYHSAIVRRIKARESLKHKLYFGPQTRTVRIEGGSPTIDAFFAVFPRHVRAELMHQQLRPVPGLDKASFATLSWPADYLRRLGVDLAAIRCDGLFVLARSNNFRGLPDYQARMRAVLAHPWTTRGHYAISYHPNEKQKDLLGAESQGMTLIDNNVPAELIYLAAGDRLRVIVGDIGTALLSARWLVPQARAVSLMHYLHFDDPPFARTLAALGIELPGSLADLQQKAS
jgi:hypothetical protein